MTNPLRVLSLVGCAAVGAILACLFGVNQVQTQLESEASMQSLTSQTVLPSINNDAWSADPAGPASQSAQPDFTIPEMPELPPEQPKPQLAAEDQREFSQYQPVYSDYAAGNPTVNSPPISARDSGFTQQQELTPPEHLTQLQVPPVDAAQVSNYPQAEIESAAASTIGTPVSDAYPTTGYREIQDLHRLTNVRSDLSKVGFERESRPMVVLSQEDSRPLLTLRLGRAESRPMTPLELAHSPRTPVTPARPVIRDKAPQTSLFVEVDDRDLTCSIKAEHVEMRRLLTMLGERAGVWITATQRVNGLVSAEIAGMRIEEALEQIVLPLGYAVGVRGDAILVGQHDEVSGYDRRLSDFAEYEQMRVAQRQANLTPQTAVVASSGQAESPQVTGRDSENEQHATDQVRLVSYSEAYTQPNSRGAIIPNEVAGPSDLGNAVSSQPSEEIPMHASPNGVRPPSSEAVLDARRANLANEQDNIVSIIAERAMNLMRDGEYRRTVNMLSHLVTEHNRSAQLFQLLGEAYYHCDQIQAAEVSLKHSLQLYKNDARANYFMGCTLHTMGERQRALHYLLQAHDLDPMYPPIVSKQALAPR